MAACGAGAGRDADSKKIDPERAEEIIRDAPQLSPKESLRAMHVEDGFEVKLVAAEPLVNTPVAMTFDDKGRIWVLEMEGYMPDVNGNGEDVHNGKIVILEDKDGDGAADERKVFMDSLQLPRALCLVEDGILVAEPPNLWYVKIMNDRAGKKTLVDSAYTEGGNVEHQPNGLIRSLDNWIYSANSGKKYKKKGNEWLIERTHDRGQWGITQDDYGRLYYNNNSQNLLGDYFMPGLGAGNRGQRSVSGYDTKIVPNNRVYPARPTTGVNRGYMEKILDDSSRLVNFTAACGPVVYRSSLFDQSYYNNVFVAEPSANLIKRNILEENGNIMLGKQAYEGREFLTSIDERFRPVSLYEGPDGALYIVDMYRGIIQHKTYLTDYLKQEIQKRSLTKPLNCGRIYKIVPTQKSANPVIMPQDPVELVNLLNYPAGWVRDKAQQMLVDGKYTTAESTLRDNLDAVDDPLKVIHSLWIMEGLGVLKTADVLPLLKHSNWKIRVQGLTVLSSVLNKNNYSQFVPVLQKMINSNDTVAAPYIAFQAGLFRTFDPATPDALLLTLAKKFPDNLYVSDAIISNLQGREASFYKKVIAINPDSNLAINRRFKKTLGDITKNEINKNLEQLKAQFSKGVNLFQTICKTCHGEDGNGVASLAPPLNNSKWVTGDKNKLIAIVLQGLTGPVKVNNKLYEPPEISGEMPGLYSNDEIDDETIAQVLSFIRKNWSNRSGNINTKEVTKMREKLKGREKAFTVEELNSW